MTDCPECSGSGEVYSLPSERYDPRKCPECKGTGKVDAAFKGGVS